jgi:5-(carboxyamino)imidazole ribonucleotide synthase
MTTAAHTIRTIGILGAGQLGLMLSDSLSDLGAQVCMLEPNENSPGAARTNFVTLGSFDDEETLRQFFSKCDRVTYEFEHIPTSALRRVLGDPAHRDKLWPSLTVLENSQNRIAEKKALAAAGAPVARWKEIQNHASLVAEKSDWLKQGKAAILKTATGGYDGKGQWRLSTETDWNTTLENLLNKPSLFPLVLEERCDLEMEISVLVGRHPTLGTFFFPATENIHIGGVLDTTLHPPRLNYETCFEAQKIASQIAERWDVFGLLCVEFFVVGSGQNASLLVNEVAPRPHNSGHITRRSMSRSQFDILAQILLDLPFVSHQIAPELTWAMWNTLGDLWMGELSPEHIHWPEGLLAHSAVCEAMLYGKKEARTGRKMGHVIITSPKPEQAQKTIEHLRSSFRTLKRGSQA